MTMVSSTQLPVTTANPPVLETGPSSRRRLSSRLGWQKADRVDKRELLVPGADSSRQRNQEFRSGD